MFLSSAVRSCCVAATLFSVVLMSPTGVSAQAATKSDMAGITLPEGATADKSMAQAATSLFHKLLQERGATADAAESYQWKGKPSSDTSLRRAFAAALKSGGYEVQTLSGGAGLGPSVVAIEAKKDDQDIVAAWLPTEGYSQLVMVRLKGGKGGTGDAASDTDGTTDSSDAPAAKSAEKSKVLGISIPGGVFRASDSDADGNMRRGFQTLVGGRGFGTIKNFESLVWTDSALPAAAEKYKKPVLSALSSGGYTYTPASDNSPGGDVEFFSVSKGAKTWPGYWVRSSGALVLAWGEAPKTGGSGDATDDTKPEATVTPKARTTPSAADVDSAVTPAPEADNGSASGGAEAKSDVVKMELPTGAVKLSGAQLQQARTKFGQFLINRAKNEEIKSFECAAWIGANRSTDAAVKNQFFLKLDGLGFRYDEESPTNGSTSAPFTATKGLRKYVGFWSTSPKQLVLLWGEVGAMPGTDGKATPTPASDGLDEAAGRTGKSDDEAAQALRKLFGK